MAGDANAEQAEYWNDVAGQKWVALQERLDAQLDALGAELSERAALRPGLRVLDVGCGCGASSFDAAQRVSPGGTVLALDLSGPMLAHARQRASAGRHTCVTFRQADVQTAALPAASMDRVISRFGVMFFSDPVAAFRNVRTTLVPAGRLAFLCWQALADNPWMLEPLRAVARHIELPPPPPPDAPGPFAFADADRVRGILEGAGFIDVAFEPITRRIPVGGARTLAEAGEFAIEIGPAGRALREADASPSLRAQVAAAAGEALREWLEPDGVRAPCAAWIVSAGTPR